MLSFFRNTVTIATLGLLAWAPLASAGFTDDCRNVCLGSDSDNYLVTECTVDGLPTDSSYQWSTLDLNLVLGYNAPNIVYQQNGGFSINNAPCGNCGISGSILTCQCQEGTSSIDLNSYISDVTGTLCFASDSFGPICGGSTGRTC